MAFPDLYDKIYLMSILSEVAKCEKEKGPDPHVEAAQRISNRADLSEACGMDPEKAMEVASLTAKTPPGNTDARRGR